MADTSAIWQQAAHTTYQLSSPSCSTRAIQKSLTLNEKYLRVFWKKVRRMDHEQKNDKTARARGLRRNKQEEIGNNIPEIPDRRMTSDIPGLPLGPTKCKIGRLTDNTMCKWGDHWCGVCSWENKYTVCIWEDNWYTIIQLGSNW